MTGSGRRTLAIARKSMTQFRHDRRTLGFVVGMPLLMVIVFGYTFGGEVHNVRTLVVDNDTGPLASYLLQNVTGDTLELVSATDADAARAEIVAGRAWALLVFPANFTARLTGRNSTFIDVSLDGSSPPIVSAVLGKLRAAMEKTFAVGGRTALSLNLDYVYGSPDTRFIDSFAPGVVALAVLMVTTVFSVIVLVREKSGGTLERLFATPLRPVELVIGHAIALALLALLQSTVVLAAALLLFQIQVVGNIGLAFGLLLLFAVGNQGLGMMLSSAARNELQAVQTIPLILFPSILLTGVFFPLEAIPGGLRVFSYLVPLTYASDALRSVMLRGWGVGEIWVQIVVLFAYAFLALLGAAVFVRRQA
ncbi:MAG TPA: ABC transporter permease [Thermoplasmata archaeon]|nr:ABC transporter permease [Thermoplasmata archaeon]